MIRVTIRNKDCGIEEVKCYSALLKHAELLDDTLRRVRSFHVDIPNEDDVYRLAGSFERTKAHGDNLVRLRVDNHWTSVCPMSAVAVVRCNVWGMHVLCAAYFGGISEIMSGYKKIYVFGE